MPNKCCVPQCRGNYKTGPKVHVFKFPQDKALQQSWIRAIPRKNFVPSEHSRVCEHHFTDDDIVREASYVDDATGRVTTAELSHLRLRSGAIPSLFPGCPSYLSSTKTLREEPEAKRTRLEAASMQRGISESIQTFGNAEEADKITTLRDLASEDRSHKSQFWHVIEASERLMLVHIIEDEAPWIKYSIVIKSDLSITLFFVKKPLTRLGPNLPIPSAARSKREIIELLQNVENWDKGLNSNSGDANEDIGDTIRLLLNKFSTTPADDKAKAIEFLSEQLNLLFLKKERRRYSVEFMVYCCILFTVSPHAYKYIRSYGYVTLPHPMTIRSICSSFGMNPRLEHHGPTFLNYVTKRISELDDRQRFVTLMVDEVHIKPYFDYKGGNITGAALNSSEVATSAFVFMIQSVACPFKEVAHIVPVHKADGEFLHNLLKDVICGLENIGYRVLCVVSDNHSVNRKAMSQFTTPPTNAILYPHPSDPSRPLFFVIDPVHILKCIRNNWLNQKNDQLCFYFPDFNENSNQPPRMRTASFATIREAYKLESDQLLRYGYSLSRKALYPSSLERQNVMFALQIFNDSLPPALRALGEKHSLLFPEDTASFIEVIAKWWKVVNVKTPWKGKRLNDRFQEPVFPSEDDMKVAFLYKILDWLDSLKEKNLDSGVLTKETHASLHQTTHALVEVSRYCFDELQLSYVLLGKFQTDSLEDRFGKYRQLAGSQYHVSIRQVYESETKLRLQNTLPTIASACGTNSSFDEQWEYLRKQIETPHANCNVVVTRDALSKIQDIIPVLVYVAGYAVYATLKKLNCMKCRAALTVGKTITVSAAQKYYHLVKDIDRGGLIFPALFAVNAVTHNYVVVEQVSKKAEFLRSPNQRRLVTELTLQLLADQESSDFDTCEDGHTVELLLKHVLWNSTNILLKNFCRKLNDDVADANAKAKERKAATLSRK
ncbi:uncharacterized protein LOC144100614 [Amblyomma americanum]